MMHRRGKFTYDATTFEATISGKPWSPRDSTEGGSRTAASGSRASYVVRRDYLLEVTVRIWEDEWLSLYNLIIWGQGDQAFTWFPDAEEVGSFQVYLESPLAGTSFGPVRSSEFPRTLSMTLVLRGVGTSNPFTPFFVVA